MGVRGVICILPVLLLISASPLSSSEERPPYVSPREVKDWLDAGQPVTFLDVREADEFAAAHLPGAINVVYSEVASLAARLPHDHPIVLYCIHSAHRAPAAAKTLQGLGFGNVYVLEGGIVAWHTGGMEIRAADLGVSPTILPKTERCDGAKSL